MRRRLPGRVCLLQGLELSLQLPERKRKIEVRSNKKGLHEKNGGEKDQDPCNEQGKAKSRPALSSRIGKNKRCNGMGRFLCHLASVNLRSSNK